MALSNSAESDLLALLFRNTTWAGIGDVTGLVGSTTAGSLYISLHTGTLTGASDQSTSEATYTGYARVAVSRASGSWTISGSSPTSVSNTNAITFGACTAGSSTVTYFAVGKSSSGTGEILFFGALTASLAISAGITPQFAAAALSCSVL